jgi:hypothetical protein
MLPDPAGACCLILSTLAAQQFASLEIERSIAELIGYYGERVAQCIRECDFKGMREELLILLGRAIELQPSLKVQLAGIDSELSADETTAPPRRKSRKRKA